MIDLDLKLNSRVYEQIDKTKSKFKKYKSRIQRSKAFLQNAKEISKSDIAERLQTLSQDPKPKHAIALLRNLLNSGTWIGRSTIIHLQSLVDFTRAGDNAEHTPDERKILKAVEQGNQDIDFEEDEIFKTIYNEVEYSHYYPEHQPLLHLKHIDVTIVLVSGVFNELFSSAAFERAAIHLKDNFGINYFCPKVNGFKSSKHNADLLANQLKKYVRKHPNEKLWLVSYSKGGIDTLHFLRNEVDFANEHIVGVSTIASPILGSDHFNHRLIKLLSNINNFSKSNFNKIFDDSNDALATELTESISSTYQRPWLRNNHQQLPENLFYTALGFESKWYESHFWMILAKSLFKSRYKNDGVVDAENSLFPYYFERGHNLGIVNGHHLVSTRSSYFCQEALLESLIIYLNYRGLIF
jgi:hypothetical protein